MTKLGRALPYHLGSWHWSIFSRRSRRACNATSLECKQPKEVLLLINIFMVNLFFLYIKCSYFLLFSSHKCLNLNPIMLEVLEPDDLGQLTLIRSSHKCLSLNSIMPVILELNDLNGLASQCHVYRQINLKLHLDTLGHLLDGD